MTVRRFNYTNRVRIHRSAVNIRLFTGPDAPPRFDADFDLEGLGLPPDAALVLEAYRDFSNMRFAWGTAGAPRAPLKRELSAFSDGDAVRFRLKVVGSGPDSGRLLAVADRLVPETDGDRALAARSLLAVMNESLGGEAWRLEQDDASDFVLKIETELGSASLLVQRPEFRALVLPAAVREILRSAAPLGDDDEDSESPEGKWIHWAEALCGKPKPDVETGGEFDNWVNEVVNALCHQHQLVQPYVEAQGTVGE